MRQLTYLLRIQGLVVADQPEIVRKGWDGLSIFGKSIAVDDHIHPENQVGYTMAGEEGAPNVLKAIWAFESVCPHCRSQSPTS